MDRRTLVYVCAPFSGEVIKNKEKAIKCARFVFEQGRIPITPHLLFPFLSDETNREDALSMDIRILKKCDEIWVFGENITSGMKEEIECASEYSIIVKFINAEVD